MMETKCLNPKCEKKEYARGLCKSCYQTASYLVREKETTWEELVRDGRAHEAHGKSGKSAKSWLLGW